MNVLITGGMGLIGHNIVRVLERTKFNNITITDTKTNYGFIPQTEIDYLMEERQKRILTKPHAIDIRNYHELDDLFSNAKPDVVYHLASYPRQKAVEANPCLASDVMNTGLTNLLELSVKHNVKRFIYVSSSMVYGDFENDVTEETPCNPIGQYGIFKLMGEHLVKDYHRRTGLEYTIIRPSAVYGEYDVEDRVVSKFILTAMRGGVIKVNGPDEVLDFSYVDDVASGIARLPIFPRSANQTYNITRSDDKLTTLQEAAELAVKIAGSGSIEVRERDLSFPKRGKLNIKKAQLDIAYQPQVSVEEGFQRYYDWLKKSTYYWNKS
jgi:nucleoside-diphosphate-sugar epimerase